MTTLTFRRLRQAELIKWFQYKFGKNWRASVALDMGLPIVRTYRWLKDDISGRIQEQMETYAYGHGFVSIYDESLAGYHHHGLIMEDVMKRAATRITREGNEKTLPGAAFPLDASEVEELLAGLNYKLVEQR